MRGPDTRGSVACQTGGQSARAKAAPTDRSHNAMTVGVSISDAARRVLTERKTLHAISRLQGL